jgi:hypothetical protein
MQVAYITDTCLVLGILCCVCCKSNSVPEGWCLYNSSIFYSKKLTNGSVINFEVIHPIGYIMTTKEQYTSVEHNYIFFK